MAKKTKTEKRLYITIKQAENGYSVRVNNADEDDWDYKGKTHLFLTTGALIEFIEQLV